MQAEPSNVQKIPINLVLGSGGARGLCHIGVIHELLREGYEIRSVSGCSMGALVGALYASGHLDEYEQWVTQLTRWDVVRFLDLSQLGRAGMVNGDRLMERLSTWLGGVAMESLPVPVTVVAADILARKEIWITSGDLLEAVRASIAVPGVFTPLVKNGRVLVDGGILNPLPIPPARLDNSVITVAVSLSGRDVAHPFGESVQANPARAEAALPTTSAETEPALRSRIEAFLAGLPALFGREPAGETHGGSGTNAHEMRSSPALTDVMLGMFGTMQDKIARHQLAGNPPDLLIDIPSNICQAHEFHKARALIDAGTYWARRALQEQSDAPRPHASRRGGFLQEN